MLGTQRGLCPGSLGVSATLTLFGPSSLEGSDCWARSLDSRGPTFQTESTSLEPGPCKTNKRNPWDLPSCCLLPSLVPQMLP